MKDKIYTVDQVAELLDLHPKTVRRFIKDGKLKANKIGNQWRITENDLRVFTLGENTSALLSTPTNNSIGNTAGNPLTTALDPATAVNSASAASNATDKPIEPAPQGIARPKAQVTSIVDVYVESRAEADRIANTLLAVMLGKDPGYGLAKFDHLFYESEMKVKLILHGQPALISQVLEIISQIID